MGMQKIYLFEASGGELLLKPAPVLEHIPGLLVCEIS